MTSDPALQHLLALLHDDQELLSWLKDEGFLPAAPAAYTSEHAEVARVAGTLVHELEVNWAGAAIVLRLRSELLATRGQMAELLALLRAGRTSGGRGPAAP